LTFTPGEILTAANLNVVSDPTVMVFDDDAARTAAIPSPVEGMVTYLKDTDKLDKFDGANFVDAAPGKILQVVSTVKTDTFVTSSTSFTAVTGLGVTITPTSNTSKVLVLVQLSYGGGEFSEGLGAFKVVGGNTSSYVGDTSSSRVRAVFGGFNVADTGQNTNSGSIVVLDSPATTSATTYQVECRQTFSGSARVNRSATFSDSAGNVVGASSITVMEVAG
jgi:hypothetical protein